MFSTSINHQEVKTLGTAIREAFRAINVRMFLYFLPQRIPLPGERAFRRAISTIDGAIFRIVSERRRRGDAQNDILSLLLHARDAETGTGMDDRQVRDELVTMFVAGSETTALVMTWLWYVLDRYPEVDRKLRKELGTVLGGRAPTFADLAKLEYTKMVLMETMRLYPPAWFLPRFTKDNAVIGGYSVPAGSPILMSPYVTHRDPAFWEHPDTFAPERFTPERSARRPRYAYLPFGGGPRQCIGIQFSLMEAQIITAIFAQRFRLRVIPGHRVVPHSATTLRPRGGLPMTLARA
jgi:cytochrome P450